MRKLQIPPMAEPPKQPRTITLKITKEQIAGIKQRQATLFAAQNQQANFMSGIVAGHGYGDVETVEIDDVKLTLTIRVPT